MDSDTNYRHTLFVAVLSIIFISSILMVIFGTWLGPIVGMIIFVAMIALLIWLAYAVNKQQSPNENMIVEQHRERTKVSIDGKVTTDNEYLNRISSIDQNIMDVALEVKNMQELKNLVMEQQRTINTLLRLIPKEE